MGCTSRPGSLYSSSALAGTCLIAPNLLIVVHSAEDDVDEITLGQENGSRAIWTIAGKENAVLHADASSKKR
jgi:hypothetical protein